MNNQLTPQQTKRIEEEAQEYIVKGRISSASIDRMKETAKFIAYVSGATSEALRNIELEKEINDLNEWKESAMKVFNDIDLQECSKVLNLPLGSDIAKHILPSLQKLTAEALRGNELCEAINRVLQGELNPTNILQQALKNYNL